MSGQALLIVDVQKGAVADPSEEGDALVSRLNGVAARLRARHAPVIFIQHRGPEGSDLHPSQPGHALHEGLAIEPEDRIIAKASCDAFLDTDLTATLAELGVDELIVAGCATDFCVDTTIRSALARRYPTIVPADGHTTADWSTLSKQQIIEHHNAIWANFSSPVGPARLTQCDAIA